MRVVFLGSDEWAVPSLRRLNDAVDVTLVVTRSPRPAGRGSVLRRTDVAAAVSGMGPPLVEVDRIGDAEGVSRLRDLEPDAMAVVAYGEILTRGVLSVAPCVNLHFSLLPRWRGAAPVQRALLAGDEVTGATTMLMDEGLDTGPILMSEEIVIDEEDDAGSLGGKLADAGAGLLVRTLLELRGISPTPQSGETSYAPKLTAADRAIDWLKTADEEARRVRAFSPEPGATTRFRGKGLKVFGAVAVEIGVDAANPGEVTHIDRDGFAVACGRGALRVEALGSEGRSRMPAEEWLRGARLSVGERLG